MTPPLWGDAAFRRQATDSRATPTRRRLAAPALAVLALAAAAPSAHAATESSWAYFGQGRQPLDSDRVSAEAALGPVDVERSSGTLEISRGITRLQITPRDRTRVRRGVYVNGRNATVELKGGCGDPVEARAEVREVAYGRDGKPNRLHVLFEHRCLDDVLTYGEARHNVKAPDAPVSAVPAIVRWGALDRGARGAAVPVTLTAPGGARVTSIQAGGPFPVVEDGCGGQTLAAGATCTVWVAFHPSRPGTHRSRLTATFAGGATRRVPLQGFVYGGRTSFTLDGRTLRPPQAAITVVPAFGGFRVQAVTRDGRLQASFEGPGERRLRRGRYVLSTRRDSPELEAGADGLVCQPRSGSFTITHLRLDRAGSPLEVGARFRMRCENGTRTGSIGWRAGDRTERASWIDP